MNAIGMFYKEMAAHLGNELVLLLGAMAIALLLFVSFRRTSSRGVNVLVITLNVLLVPNAFILAFSIALTS